MLGDVLSNQSVALSGGLGLAASVNAGAEHAAANAGHGSAPDIAGKGIANPAGIILSTAMLLRWLGTKRSNNACIAAADAIETAVDRSEEHTSELQSLMPISYAVLCLKKKKNH